jgi:hypothetical protein
MDQTGTMRWANLWLELMVLFLLIFGMVAAKIMKDIKRHY